tara:strand:+ start:198 stop:479 length:282 start_codon:yes stop_codon:yes gene_type:complete
MDIGSAFGGGGGAAGGAAGGGGGGWEQGISNLIATAFTLFVAMGKHPSEGTLPNYAKGSDVILADSDTHLIPYIYLVGTIMLVIISVVIIFKK